MKTIEAAMTVCKVQLDLSGHEVLVYSEDHALFLHLDTRDPGVPGEVARTVVAVLKMKPFTKRYIHAGITEDGKFVLGENAPEQEW